VSRLALQLVVSGRSIRLVSSGPGKRGVALLSSRGEEVEEEDEEEVEEEDEEEEVEEEDEEESREHSWL
jgi:hypothetical protein